MQYTRLGHTGLQVSRLCLGTMNFGPETPESESHAIMDKALELGFNFFDTADVYGWKKGEGVTEQIVGRWFAADPSRRAKVVLATKVFGEMGEGPNQKRGLSALKIRQGCDNSLRRLKTDYIDLYQMHHIARETPWEEIWQAYEVLIQQGKVIYAGSSNFAGWHIATANHVAKRHNMLGLVCEQSKYSLACRYIEGEVIPACRYWGLGIIPWSPLDGGLLGGVLTKTDTARRDRETMRKRVEELRPTLEKWESFCKELGESPAHVALAWTLHNPAITAPIIGPRTMDHLTGALRALKIKLDAEAMRRLDAIWPGPGAEAPEYYAW